jgi:serine/threonine-protein kinase
MLDDYGVDGSFSTQRTVAESQPGTYLICLWIADWSGGTAIAGPQPETFTVPAPPPPPCVVGTKLVGLALATAEQRLNGSHCTVGAVSSVYSDTVPAGDVITTSPGPGHYPSGQSVAIVVSAGPPVCIAPRLRGLTFRRAKARLRHAHCSVGAVRRPRHVRRGHVLHVRRQSVPAGSRHRDGYPIAITLV